MENKSEKKTVEEYVEKSLRELAATRVTGKLLQKQLADLVDLLATEGVSQAEARLFLQRVYKRERREHSSEFHRRLRDATKGTSHQEVKRIDREQCRQAFKDLREKAGVPEHLARVLFLPSLGKKTGLH